MGGPVTLNKYGTCRDEHAEQTGYEKYPRAEGDSVTIAGQPVVHEVPDDWDSQEERNQHVGEEGAYQSGQHLATVAPEHLAYGNFLVALLDKIRTHSH